MARSPPGQEQDMSRNPMLVVMSAIDDIIDPSTGDTVRQVRTALDLLAEYRVPLVLCGSHTRAQLEQAYRSVAGHRHPFIAENGAALFCPLGYFGDWQFNASQASGYLQMIFGRPHSDVTTMLHAIAQRLCIEICGLSELPVEQLAITTHMSVEQVRLAQRREYDEPFVVLHADRRIRNRLVRALLRAELRCWRSQAWTHVNSGRDRQQSLRCMRALYERVYGPVLLVGLARSFEDSPLQKEADLPIIVRSRSMDTVARLRRTRPDASITISQGPAGWAGAVVDVVRLSRQMRDASVWARSA